MKAYEVILETKQEDMSVREGEESWIFASKRDLKTVYALPSAFKVWKKYLI